MIETDLARIADALEGINVKLAYLGLMYEDIHWNKERLAALEEKKAPAAKPEEPDAEPEKEEAPAPETPSMSYDELKEALIARGVEIPKGTKMTTLLKKWESHKDDPVQETVAEEEPAPVEEEPELPLEEEVAPVVEEKAPMTFDEARTALLAAYDKGSDEDRNLLRATLESFGYDRLPMSGVDDYRPIVASYYEKKGIALDA